MSPILMRPVREQLEHDRVIRLLQARWRRRYQVGINPGNEQTAAVGQSTAPIFPDLVLWSTARSRKVEGIVEVETAESVNNMEALAEWVPFGRLRAPFYLYIPNGSVDNARRMIADNSIAVAEIWTYYQVGDQMRFTMVYRAPTPPARQPRRATAPRSRTVAPGRKPVGRRPAKSAATTRKRARPARKTRTASRAQKRK